jgi:hypothetical protein
MFLEAETDMSLDKSDRLRIDKARRGRERPRHPGPRATRGARGGLTRGRSRPGRAPRPTSIPGICAWRRVRFRSQEAQQPRLGRPLTAL